MATLKQKSAFGPGVYRGHPLPLETLRSFVDGTNKAIAAGVPIPLLLKHAPINASDEETEQFATADGKGAGWITKVDIEDGAIAWEAKDVPEQVVKAKEEGRLKFTSPEFRPHYTCEKEGVYEGPIIRHFAFTPLPGNPHQGEILTLALSEGCWQFTEGECEPLDDKHLSKLHASQHGEDMDNVTPPSTVPPDEHYKNSLSVDAHKPGVTNPSEEDESIDWDTLTVQEHNEILAKIERELTDEDDKLGEEAMFHKQHGGQHMMKEPFGSTGNPAPWVADEDKWNKAKKVIGNKYGGEGNKKHWAVVTSVYKKMGGKVNKQSQHAEDPKDNNPMDEQTKKKKKAEDMDVEETAESSTPPETMQPDANTNPDMPPKTTDRSKLAAVLAGLNQKGVVLPSDFCFEDEHSIDVLLAAINSSIKAEMEAEAESEPDEDDAGANSKNVSDAPMPFSEEELTALPKRVREAILREQEQLRKEKEARKQAELKAQQYEEEKENLRNETARNEAKNRINSAHIPPVLKNKLLAAYDQENCIQFAEGLEKPYYSGVEVAEMLAASLPPSLQFEVEDTKESEVPKGQVQIGTDAFGNPVYRQATSEQFFETAPDGQLISGLHLDPAKAEEVVKSSPLGLVIPRGSNQLPPPTTMRR